MFGGFRHLQGHCIHKLVDVRNTSLKKYESCFLSDGEIPFSIHKKRLRVSLQNHELIMVDNSNKKHRVSSSAHEGEKRSKFNE